MPTKSKGLSHEVHKTDKDSKNKLPTEQKTEGPYTILNRTYTIFRGTNTDDDIRNAEQLNKRNVIEDIVADTKNKMPSFVSEKIVFWDKFIKGKKVGYKSKVPFNESKERIQHGLNEVQISPGFVPLNELERSEINHANYMKTNEKINHDDTLNLSKASKCVEICNEEDISLNTDLFKSSHEAGCNNGDQVDKTYDIESSFSNKKVKNTSKNSYSIDSTLKMNDQIEKNENTALTSSSNSAETQLRLLDITAWTKDKFYGLVKVAKDALCEAQEVDIEIIRKVRHSFYEKHGMDSVNDLILTVAIFECLG